MIRVVPQPEPPGFDAAVRQPGIKALASGRRRLAPFWRLCLPDLYASYKGICAYYGSFVYPATGTASTDHFIPKSTRHDLAYEWSNYRFACLRANARKGTIQRLLDPFTIQDGWFQLEFNGLQVIASTDLSPARRAKVENAIEVLGLNEPEVVGERTLYYESYRSGCPVDYLVRFAPFVALEACRQGYLLPGDSDIKASDIRRYLDK